MQHHRSVFMVWPLFAVLQTRSTIFVSGCHHHHYQQHHYLTAIRTIPAIVRAVQHHRRRLRFDYTNMTSTTITTTTITTTTTAAAAETAVVEHHHHPADNEADNGYVEVLDAYGQSAYEKWTNDSTSRRRCCIRIEKGPDQVIFGSAAAHHDGKPTTYQSDLLDQIARVIAAQQLYGNATLLNRQWLRRPLQGTDDTSNKIRNNAFTVMQFNTLAEGLSAGPDTVRPFRRTSNDDDDDTVHASTTDNNNNNMEQKQQADKNDVYGGFNAIPEPSVVLDFAAYRRWRLLEVLLRGTAGAGRSTSNSDDRAALYHHNLSLFDVIALEEVDRFYGFFAPALRIFGYDGVFTPKWDSPGCRNGWYSDGCCMFWKMETFDLICVKRGRYKVGTQVYMIVTLRHRSTHKVLVVAVTHLKAQASAANELVRSHQAKELIERVDQETHHAKAMYSDPDPGVVIAGDFNAEPGCTTLDNESLCSTISMVLDSTRNGGKSTFTSAYPVDDPTKLSYSTWKIRGTLEVKRTIDYILFRGPMSCDNLLLAPADDIDDDGIGTNRLPSLRYPSDHLHIAAQFEFHDD